MKTTRDIYEEVLGYCLHRCCPVYKWCCYIQLIAEDMVLKGEY